MLRIIYSPTDIKSRKPSNAVYIFFRLSLPLGSCRLFLQSVYHRKTPAKDAVLWRAVLRLCAWMKISCGIKSARRSPLLYDLFICLVVFFSRATKRAYTTSFARSVLELTEGVLFNARVEILVFWYFHLVANSRRFSSARKSILRAYICKASTHTWLCIRE